MRSTLKVEEVNQNNILRVNSFVRNMMTSLFPFPLSKKSFDDLENMESFYIQSKEAQFLIALNDKNDVIGTIAYRRYDDRIQSIKGKYDVESTCELVKCYVHEDYRRKGIGTALYTSIKEHCRKSGYKTIYLHTHKFLPGGLFFWQSKGFVTVLDEQDGYETVHMERDLEKEA